MSKPGTIAEARENARELEMERKALVDQLATIKAQRAPAEARLARNTKRREARPVVVFAANEWTRSSMALLRGDAKYGVPAEAKPKDIPALVTDGSVKVSISSYGYGQSYTARGLAKRVVTPTTADLKAWDRARKARERAEAVLSKAEAAEKAAAKEAFDNGVKVGFDELVADIAADVTLRVALDRLANPGKVEGQLNQLVDGQMGKLSIAKRHLDHLVKKAEDPECSTCKWAERKAIEVRERTERIQALPRAKRDCPDHGKRIGFLGTERGQWIGHTQGYEQVPVWYCPVDLQRYTDGRAKAEAEAAAAKAAAKAARHQPKLVRWICPNPDCSDDEQESEPEAGQVVCDFCEVGWDIDRIKVTPVRPAKAA